MGVAREVLLRVWRWLDERDLSVAGCSGAGSRRLAEREELWLRLFRRRWPREAARRAATRGAGTMRVFELPWKLWFLAHRAAERAEHGRPAEQSAEAEDWLDFEAAMGRDEAEAPPQREQDLPARLRQHQCTLQCGFKREGQSDRFVGECGYVHECPRDCDTAGLERTDDNGQRVCLLSGISRDALMVDEGCGREEEEEPGVYPGFGPGWYAQCVEHGYGMTEEEANQAFYGGDRAGAHLASLCGLGGGGRDEKRRRYR